MADISRGLENVADVPKLYQALHLCQDAGLVYDEALNSEFRIGRKVKKIKSTFTCAGTKVLTQALLAQWSDEKRDAPSKIQCQ